jgi:hypothetical protein
MPGTDDTHALLPWHLNGTLDAEERALFAGHLAACPDCRREAEVLTEVRDAVRRRGGDLFEPHPPAEEIVEHAEGRLDGGRAAAVGRHLEVCSTCLVEDGIVRRGGLPALPAAPRAARRSPLWAAGAAAAALAVVAIALFVARPRDAAPPTGPVAAFYVPAPERDAAITEIPVPHGAVFFQVVLPIEAAGGGPPLSIRIEDATGRRVFAQDGVTDVYRDALLLVLCSRADFPDGDYLARVTPAPAAGAPAPAALEFRFRVRGR